jgi:hypothetical protein
LAEGLLLGSRVSAGGRTLREGRPGSKRGWPRPRALHRSASTWPSTPQGSNYEQKTGNIRERPARSPRILRVFC